ncbi:MAG: CPBP family intramembrane metalloprotease [Oscillospiraceae bacterium]|nr:CPBP family intramembrane metalloprotease [Oscillospiraceae bacterium]
MENYDLPGNGLPEQYQQYQPPVNNGQDITQDPVMLRKRIKKGYGWTGLSMILQFVFMMTVSIIASIIYSTVMTAGFMAENPGASQAQLMEFAQELSQSVTTDIKYNNIVNTAAYLIANLSAAAIGIAAVKAFRTKELFGKSRLSAKWIAAGVLGALGIQAVSMFIQIIMIKLTGLMGISEQAASMVSMSDDILLNILILFYFVIVAPVTEEFLMRGMIMNSLAPVNRKFALIASALLFGIMHGNFNQMFNGFLLGLIFGYIALKSGSIIPSIIAHMTVNANVMFCTYVYEYKVLEASGEDAASTFELIHFAVFMVIGIIALIFFLKRNGKIVSEDMVTPEYSYEIAPTEAKKLTWGLLAKCPSVWIVTIIYLLIAIFSVNAV